MLRWHLLVPSSDNIVAFFKALLISVLQNELAQVKTVLTSTHLHWPNGHSLP